MYKKAPAVCTVGAFYCWTIYLTFNSPTQDASNYLAAAAFFSFSFAIMSSATLFGHAE